MLRRTASPSRYGLALPFPNLVSLAPSRRIRGKGELRDEPSTMSTGPTPPEPEVPDRPLDPPASGDRLLLRWTLILLAASLTGAGWLAARARKLVSVATSALM